MKFWDLTSSVNVLEHEEPIGNICTNKSSTNIIIQISWDIKYLGKRVKIIVWCLGTHIQSEGYIQKAWLENEKFCVFWEEINFMEKVDEVVVNFPQSAEWEENILNFPGQMPNVSENLWKKTTILKTTGRSQMNSPVSFVYRIHVLVFTYVIRKQF